MKLVRNILAGGVAIVGIMALLSVLYDNVGSYVAQQEKYLLTADNADLALTITFYVILLFPVVLSFLLLSYLLSDVDLTKPIRKTLANIFALGSVVSGVFAGSVLFFFAVLPAMQQLQLSLFIQNVVFISPIIILFILTLLAYRKTRYELRYTK